MDMLERYIKLYAHVIHMSHLAHLLYALEKRPAYTINIFIDTYYPMEAKIVSLRWYTLEFAI